MKVLILGGSNSRNSGGVFDTARTLGLNVNKLGGVDVQFLMYEDEYSFEDSKYYGGLPLHSYTVNGPLNLGFSKDLYKRLSSIQPDLIHTQSIWMYLSYINKIYCSRTRTPYIVSPHGMLDPWQLKQSVWKKKLALTLYEQKHLEKAACICALGMDEYEAIRTFGLKNPVAIIPNGVNLPVINRRYDNYPTAPRWVQKDNRKTLLFLSRIHPKKGLDHTLEAWALTKPHQHNWQLVIVGETKDQKYMHSLKEIAYKLKINDTVQFIGGQFGKDKETCFIDADAFILSSFSEGLPMAVLEAWSYKLPVIMTSFCNLPEGFERKAAIKVEPTTDSVATGIQSLIAMKDSEIEVMGQNGFDLVKEKFTWQQVAASTLRLYNWVTGKDEQPDFVLQ